MIVEKMYNSKDISRDAYLNLRHLESIILSFSFVFLIKSEYHITDRYVHKFNTQTVTIIYFG